MEKRLKAGHVFDQESAILPNGISAKGRFPLLAMLGEKFQRLMFSAMAIMG
jgi:hypothetical protein